MHLQKFNKTSDIDKWLQNTAWDKMYWSDICNIARNLHSDGCSGVPDWLVWTCWEHDIHYRTHRTIDGDYLTKQQADYIFRHRIQQGSGFGVFSPAAWWRWLGVKLFGKQAWQK